MEFDLSKENIQPLRGGRNVSQLEVALHAQTNETSQRELLHQKTEFEQAIQNYIGEDPLDNWYHYISWVEQSYPKHGHEGHLVQLLENCLGIFENDKRYINDIRFCKLWIKYNDMQQNPLELYHMMHARGLCRGCTDLYRAWAYYHEATGDYRNADAIFQLGKRELAQPHDELQVAHQNMVFAAGQQLISGVDQQRLLEERRALTTLRSYRSGKVGSVRSISNAGAGVLPSGSSVVRPNIVIPIFEEAQGFSIGAEAAPVSILSVAKRQVIAKENTIKPGVWTAAVAQTKGLNLQRLQPKFTVHEDSGELDQRGLKLPAGHFAATQEDFSDFKLVLFYSEPEDQTKIPIYPKAKVYSSTETEFSIEEIRSYRYISRCAENRLNVSYVETEQAIQSILGDSVHVSSRQILNEFPQVNTTYAAAPYQLVGSERTGTDSSFYESQVVFNQQQLGGSLYPHGGNFEQVEAEAHVDGVSTNEGVNKISSRIFGQSITHDAAASFHTECVDNNKNEKVQRDLDVLWRSSNSISEEFFQTPKQNISFAIYEESINRENTQPKVSAMKTMPFKPLSDEELGETGSRGGHDIAAAAQPGDGAKRILNFEDDSSSSCVEIVEPKTSPNITDLDGTCNTQMFNFNLNVMQVSTPHVKSVQQHVSTPADDVPNTRKQLFGQNERKQMSTIAEETKSFVSSGSSGSTFKSSTLNHSKKDTMSVINEESSRYNFNLAQNLKANAALRTSLLELMDCESGQSSPVTEYPVGPLTPAPSNPFKPALLRSLLNQIGFPGRHSEGYIKLQTTPRLALRKEAIYIADYPYYMDKVLGKGTYGQVFKAVDARTNRTVALKMQKPPNCWEFYICRELKARLAKHPLRECFMDVHIGYFNDQISIFVSDFSPWGSLLDLANNFKQKAGYLLKQGPCLYLCIEMLNIVAAMHQVKIIHADIKPDNFLVYVLADGSLQLQLIDFGCSIDMTFFPPDTTFMCPVTTKDFICCEMLDDRPWSYHTDLFCVAATAHVLLFDKYMQLQKKGDQWSISQRFNRYMRVDVWNTFFSSLLNQQKGPADPKHLIAFMTEAFNSFESEVAIEMRKVINIVNNR